MDNEKLNRTQVNPACIQNELGAVGAPSSSFFMAVVLYCLWPVIYLGLLRKINFMTHKKSMHGGVSKTACYCCTKALSCGQLFPFSPVRQRTTHSDTLDRCFGTIFGFQNYKVIGNTHRCRKIVPSSPVTFYIDCSGSLFSNIYLCWKYMGDLYVKIVPYTVNTTKSYLEVKHDFVRLKLCWFSLMRRPGPN
jgi:hypothetical protein